MAVRIREFTTEEIIKKFILQHSSFNEKHGEISDVRFCTRSSSYFSITEIYIYYKQNLIINGEPDIKGSYEIKVGILEYTTFLYNKLLNDIIIGRRNDR